MSPWYVDVDGPHGIRDLLEAKGVPLGSQAVEENLGGYLLLGGGFKYFLFSSLLGEMIQFD